MVPPANGDPLARLTAELADRYRIDRPLGEGGMALVYLAEDLKHHRNVALKVLRPELAAILGAERFLKEIEVTARLQHPNILPLYDSGEVDGFLYYVMPLMEGETLRDKLDREEQLTVDEAVEIARSVAAALDYAHRHGVLHRDIKPGNILLHEGQALVADFGIALAMRNAGGETRLTETGLSIGTPHYMSPEQATGDRELDARSDIYSLGAVTYEMLVGDPPHVGRSAQAVVAKILSETPAPIRTTRELIPANVEAAVTKALARSPADRFTTAADFGAALVNPGFTLVGVAGVGAAGAAASAPTPLQRLAPVLAATTVVALGLAAWGWLRPAPVLPVRRIALAFPDSQRPMDVPGRTFDISRKGTALVYTGRRADGPPGLWVKWGDRAESVPLGVTGGAAAPAISPDAREVVFGTHQGTLLMASLQGGPPVTLVDSACSACGSAWLDDRTILYGARFVRDGHGLPPRLSLVSVQGDREGRVVGPKELSDTSWTMFPVALPGGHAALVTVCAGIVCGSPEIWAVDVESGSGHVVIRGASAAWYVDSGDVVFCRPDGSVFAQPFDVDHLETAGPAVPILAGVKVNGLSPAMALAPDGTLVMRFGAVTDEDLYTDEQVVWVARDGTVQPVDSAWSIHANDNLGWALSPDGTRLAIGVATINAYPVQIRNLVDGTSWPLTSGRAWDIRPHWSAGGGEVYFLSDRQDRGHRLGLYVRRADGMGEARAVLADSARSIFDIDESPDGKWIVGRLGIMSQEDERDIVAWHVEGSGDTTEVPLLTKDYQEIAPRLSPDGRWLAYASDESGSWRVNVSPFPGVNASRKVVSRLPATAPLWSRDGEELFYLAAAADGRKTMTVAEVDTVGGFHVVSRTPLFRLPEGILTDDRSTAYDVTPDGKRFIMVRRKSATRTQVVPLILVENWLQEVKAKIAGG